MSIDSHCFNVTVFVPLHNHQQSERRRAITESSPTGTHDEVGRRYQLADAHTNLLLGLRRNIDCSLPQEVYI